MISKKDNSLSRVFVELRWVSTQARPFILRVILIIAVDAVLSLSGVGMAILSKTLIDAATTGQMQQMIRTCIAFGIIIIAKLGLRGWISIVTTRTHESLSNHIREKLFSRITQSEWIEFSKYHSGDVLTRMTSDVGAVTGGIISTLTSLISLGVLLVASFITLLWFEPALAVLAFIVGPVSVLLSRFWGRKIKELHVKSQEAESAYRSFMHESLQNMLVIKTFSLEGNSDNRIHELHNERMELILRRSRLGVICNSVLSIGYWLGYSLAFGWGIFNLYQGTTTFGTLTAFLQLVSHVQRPFIGLSHVFPQIISTMASAGRLMEFENMQLEKRDIQSPCWEAAGIVLHNIRFAYEKDKFIVKDVCMQIKPGEITALVGPSGEGKTTLVRIILSLLRPQCGNVYFKSDRDEKVEACASTRSLISYVPQGNTLFSGTIAENLRAGCLDATDIELEAAARAACAWDFIEALPEGLKTKIGERGHGLSEGQAQRIAIARALLRKAPIMIFDEATSALDTRSEMKVLHTIRTLNPVRTCIIITHRPTALKICDRVLRLENGQLTELSEVIISSQASEAV